MVGHLDTGAKDDLTGEQILNDNTTAVEKMILFTVENHINTLMIQTALLLLSSLFTQSAK